MSIRREYWLEFRARRQRKVAAAAVLVCLGLTGLLVLVDKVTRAGRS